MDAQTNSIQFLQRQAASLLLYQSVLHGEVGLTFLALLQALRHQDADEIKCLQAYSNWFRALAETGQSWQNYLITQVLTAENPLTQQAQHLESAMPSALLAAGRQDLQALQHLYTCSSQIVQWVQAVAKLPVAPIAWDDQPLEGNPMADPRKSFQSAIRCRFRKLDNWADVLEDLVTYYRQFGTGLFSQYQALRWQSGQLVGIPHPDSVQLSQLVGYESQREALLKNTQFLLAGYPALHVLLYGSRGSGKSSLVKALLQTYSDRGLRLIEVTKSALQDLNEIVEQLRQVPQKFILFVDDLSFEEDEDTYKALKALLEGNLTARPQNVVVYATSNRRHLIREFHGDRPRPKDSEEVHAWDTVQEKLSFSDRFGLTLTFEP
ncbi:MAG TPA: ATP-binding protein, partial [Candidatus Caenarcaniphilales bacterium]